MIPAGTLVRVTSGPFSGKLATVQDDERPRLPLRLIVVDRDLVREVCVPRGDVEVVNE